YGLVNLYASTRLIKGLSLEARIDNLGDKTYELARNYATAGRNGQVSLRWSL
ncbi:TonB-dependent receptor, partial [Escherichia coli]